MTPDNWEVEVCIEVVDEVNFESDADLIGIGSMGYAIYRGIGDEIGHDIRFATISLNSNLIAAGKQGDVLYGIGNVVRKTRSVIFAEGRIFTNKNIILQATGVWKIIGVN